MTPAKISRLVSDLAYTQGFLEGVQEAYELTKSLDLEMAPLNLSGPAELLHRIIEELKQEALSGFSTNGETKQESEMPPETKQIISKLSEVTCKNCIYYAQNNNSEHYYCTNPDSYEWYREEFDHCSLGKWLTGRQYPSDFESELNLEDYDDTYYGIVRAQMFPYAVGLAEEYHVRKEVMKELETIEFRLEEGDIYVQDVLDGIKSKLNHLWGDQE